MIDFANERIVITGGDGFLGQHLQKQLIRLGSLKKKLLIPLIEDYDLTKEANVIRMYDGMNPTVAIHLAAEVGGIQATNWFLPALFL